MDLPGDCEGGKLPHSDTPQVSCANLSRGAITTELVGGQANTDPLILVVVLPLTQSAGMSLLDHSAVALLLLAPPAGVSLLGHSAVVLLLAQSAGLPLLACSVGAPPLT